MSTARTFAKASAGAAALGLAGIGAYAGAMWTRYGHADPERYPRDRLLDRFIPEPEVDEYHAMEVAAPAELTFATATQMDLMSSPPVKAIFGLRAIPSLLHGQPFRPGGSRGIVEETLAQGWGVLAEDPGREIVVGSYTQPWHEKVTFQALPPEAFAGFDEPGYVKIVWTLAAEPLGPSGSRFVTRTRVVTTDDEARKRFRRYWAPMSSGIILIRYLALPAVKREAERRAWATASTAPVTT